jgi:hypothetical protein
MVEMELPRAGMAWYSPRQMESRATPAHHQPYITYRSRVFRGGMWTRVRNSLHSGTVLRDGASEP